MSELSVKREARELLRQRRAERKSWATGVGLHDGEAIGCYQGGCDDPACEGCAVTRIRAEVVAEIDRDIAALTEIIA